MLLDTDTAVLKLLLIDGGELIFDEQNVTLSAENILITNGGRLQVNTSPTFNDLVYHAPCLSYVPALLLINVCCVIYFYTFTL